MKAFHVVHLCFYLFSCVISFFFFQAEDGIRDCHVTGVQTCALPIFVLADVVDELAGRPIARLKWPNDVLVDDRKLAGVLCEGRWQGETPQWLAVGLGVNVANEIPAAVRDFAIALAEVIPGVGRIDVLDRLVPPLTRLGAATEQLTDQECRAFAARDWLRDRALRSPVAGHARGVRPDGALLVEGEGDVAVVREGHVETA